MPNSDLFDRAEGYGHTAGSQASKDDTDWSTPVAVLAAQSEDLDTRVARTLVSRESISPDLDSAGAWDGTNTTSGSNAALANVNAVANHDVNVTYRTVDAMDSTERAAIGFADRTTGWGHTAATDADLDDA